jgi:tRNA threonylcarbamoyladenosine biosynthesis protein TsaB
VILLAIETATDTVGAALLSDDGGVVERVHEGGRAHAELLAPSIEEVCAASGCLVTDIDVVAVDVGPGLFTGLRVGVATAKALGQSLSVGVLGVGSLDILAAGAAARMEPGRPERVAAVIDARRGEVFAACYRFDGAAPAPGRAAADPAAVRHDPGHPMSPGALEAWLAEVASDAGSVRMVGDGARRYRAELSGLPYLDFGWVEELSAPPPQSLARLARARLAAGLAPGEAADVVPDYRRPADARINWEQRAPRPPSPGGPDPSR